MGMFDYFTQQKSDVGPLPEGQESGFFGTSWEDPRTQRNMALFAGLMNGGNGRGFAGAMGDGVQNMQSVMANYNQQQMAKEQIAWERARAERAEKKADPKEIERREIGRLIMNAPTGVGSHHAMPGMNAVDESPAQLPYADVQQARGDALTQGGYATEGIKFYEQAQKAREQPTNTETPLMKTMRAMGVAPGSKEWIDTLKASANSQTGREYLNPGHQEAAMARARSGTEAGASLALQKDLGKNLKLVAEENEKANAAATALDKVGFIADKITALEKNPNLDAALGLTGAITGISPFGETASIHRTINELKSANFVQGIREAKLAGFAGSQTEREGAKLETSIADLDPKDKNFRTKLTEVKGQYARFLGALEAQYGSSSGIVNSLQTVMPPGVNAPPPRELPGTPSNLIPQGMSVEDYGFTKADSATSQSDKLLRDYEAMKQRINRGAQ